MTPERSNPLHNFNLPSRLRWGTQRYLRCKKLDADDDPQQQQQKQQQQPPPPRSNRPPRSKDGSQIEAIGQKLMLDFKLRMDNLVVEVGGGADEDKEKERTAVATGDEADSSRPWNLRTRRSPAPGPEVVVEKRKERSSPVKRVRGGCSVSEEKSKVTVPLKREEIEEDFLMMAGIKPPRRPKKRHRAIQKELDTLFPGLWLTAVTPGSYDVPEAPESG